MRMTKLGGKKIAGFLVLLFSLVLFLSVFMISGAYAAGDDSLQKFINERNQLEKDRKAIQQQLKESQNEENKLRNQISGLDSQMNSLNQEIAAAEKYMAQLAGRIKQTEAEIAEKEAEILDYQGSYAKWLRESYMDGEVTALDVVFQSTSVNDFLSRMDYLNYILQYESQILDGIKEAKAELEEKQELLEGEYADQEVLLAAKEEAKKKLEAAVAEKEALVRESEANQEELKKQLDQMEADSAALSSKIKELQKKYQSSGSYNGIMAWPLPSGYKTITSNYGMRIHPILHTKRMHTGIDISAPNGTNIYAASSGTVILASWYGAYGNAVVVDHGGGVVTLYGHMSRIGCSVGSKVSRGDVIGYVGSTGYSTGNHLHFEVRVNGNVVSPWNYVSK